MSNGSKSGNVAPAPDLKSIFEKVKEIASQSAETVGRATKSSKTVSASKRSRDDGAAAHDADAEVEQQITAESSGDKSTQSNSSSAVTITFGDCAENHVGAMALEPKAA